MRKTLILLAATGLCMPAGAIANEQVQPAAEQTVTDPATEAKIAAVQRHVDAYRSGDLDRFVATFTHDAVVRADGFVAMGREQIRALYALNFVPGAPSIRVHESGLTGDGVYLSIGYVLEDGQEICCSYSEYEVTDGRVSFLRASG